MERKGKPVFTPIAEGHVKPISGDTPKEVQGTFTATGTTTYINLGIVSGTLNYSVGWDNIVVTESEQDRSVNGNGIQVFGTITKTAVATGADLVGYSGFSSSNYLEQPYNTDLDFGTGDFCVMGWINPNTESAHHGIVNRMDSGSGAGFLKISKEFQSVSKLLF